MRKEIVNLIVNKLPKSPFETIGYLPRWIVFLLDSGIVVLSCLVTYMIVASLSPSEHDSLNYLPTYLLVVFINAVFFLVFKTYSGIIRHSTFIDGVKLLISCTAAFFTVVAFNYSWIYIGGTKLFMSTALFINYIISFVLLFLFRILVKNVFEVYTRANENTQLINTVIYGADANAISIANALKTEVPARFKIRGFIDKYHVSTTSKRILNLPIVSETRKVSVILRMLKADALIIAEKSLTQPEIIKIVEECLEYNFKVFTVPLITDWEDGALISQKVKSFAIEDLLGRKPIKLNMDAISAQLDDKTILITGGAGSIGSEIVRQVLEFKPSRVLVLDQAETPLHSLTLEIAALEKNIEVIAVLADIRHYSALENVFKQYLPDVVYHAAAYKHVPLVENNPCQAVRTNVVGTKNVADLAAKYGVERFVMVSTDKAVNPSNVMGASKRIAEKYVQSLQNKVKAEDRVTKFITTRFGNVLGSNGSIVPLFTKQIEEGGPLTITHPDIIRYFMTIPEACQLVLEAGTMGQGGEIFIFDMGQPVKIIDLARKMIGLAGFTPNKEIEIKIIGLRPGEKLYEELLNDDSKTLPTHNDQIMIALDNNLEYDSLCVNIEKLSQFAKLMSNDDIVGQMKKIVPEFKSMNSVFQNLDVN
ncbi:MAG: polysaccharide biosynthesis protein [Flavobacterium sp.]